MLLYTPHTQYVPLLCLSRPDKHFLPFLKDKHVLIQSDARGCPLENGGSPSSHVGLLGREQCPTWDGSPCQSLAEGSSLCIPTTLIAFTPHKVRLSPHRVLVAPRWPSRIWFFTLRVDPLSQLDGKVCQPSLSLLPLWVGMHRYNFLSPDTHSNTWALCRSLHQVPI